MMNVQPIIFVSADYFDLCNIKSPVIQQSFIQRVSLSTAWDAGISAYLL